jgi:hypothetical protein
VNLRYLCHERGRWQHDTWVMSNGCLGCTRPAEPAAGVRELLFGQQMTDLNRFWFEKTRKFDEHAGICNDGTK